MTADDSNVLFSFFCREREGKQQQTHASTKGNLHGGWKSGTGTVMVRGGARAQDDPRRIAVAVRRPQAQVSNHTGARAAPSSASQDDRRMYGGRRGSVAMRGREDGRRQADRPVGDGGEAPLDDGASEATPRRCVLLVHVRRSVHRATRSAVRSVPYCGVGRQFSAGFDRVAVLMLLFALCGSVF
jgi:hypothetical protein